jgi:hypothetical protein
MPNLLKQLELEELSLVDRPANASAKVALYKRDNSQEDTMEEQVEKNVGRHANETEAIHG